jgi:Zn-dependent M28 family amino/carboxypeptidase
LIHRTHRKGSRRRAWLLVLGVAALAAAVAAAPAAADYNNTSKKLREAVTLKGVRAHQANLQAIADLSGGVRFAGLPGYERSADYVADQLRAAGYDVTFQYFTYNAFFENSAALLRQVSPAPATYVNGIDYDTMLYSGSGEVTGQLARPAVETGCIAGDWTGFPAGRIALVLRGGCTFRIKTNNAIAAGASAILVYNNAPGHPNGTLAEAEGLSAIPSVGISQALGQSLIAQLGTGAVTMYVKTDTGSSPLLTRNVLAEKQGWSPGNVVVVGAHLDSVSAGPGINDNGSGSAAILEVALKLKSVNPRNTIRFAWWSAEESTLVGSTFYVNSLSQAQKDEIAMNLNFDMIGSPNFVRFVYDGDNSAFPVGPGAAAGPPGSAQIEKLFHDYFASQGLPSAETPFSGRSDYGPFIAQGIPAGGLFTGAEGIKTPAQQAIYGGTAGIQYDPCYHASCDTYANNSDAALDTNSDAVAHATITYAQHNWKKAKGNWPATSPTPASTRDAGDDGGGGLHEHADAEL